MEKGLLGLLFILALPFGRVHAQTIDFSTISVDGDTGTYSIVFRDTKTTGLSTLVIHDTIELMGLGERFDGRYFVTEATHSMDGGSFTSSIKVERKGSGKLTRHCDLPSGISYVIDKSRKELKIRLKMNSVLNRSSCR